MFKHMKYVYTHERRCRVFFFFLFHLIVGDCERTTRVMDDGSAY
jgi:hypothetical protein